MYRRQGSPSKCGVNHVTFQQTFQVTYLGYAVLDRRYTLPMLPWLVAEIKRRGLRENLTIEVTDQALKACVSGSLVFEHKLQSISKFAQTSQDPACFTYLTREVATGPCAYHVFQATDENSVLEFFSATKQKSKELQGRNVPGSVDLQPNLTHLQQFEVLYLGRIRAPGKRAHDNFIDEAVCKILKYQEKNLICHNRIRHGSNTSISSLPPNLESIEDVKSSNLQKYKRSSGQDLSSCGELSSEENLSHKSLGTDTKIDCDTTHPAFSLPQSSCGSSKYSLDYPSHIQSLVPHSQSMDFFSTCQMLKELNNFEIKDNLMLSSATIPHTQSLDSSGSGEIVCDLKDMNPCVPLRDRVRSCSGDIPRVKENVSTYHQQSESGSYSGRPRSYTNPSSSDRHPTNRTMLFLIGNIDICLISTDKKQILLRKQFNEISHCQKGIKYTDHFGIICRESTSSKIENYQTYIFRCQDYRTTEEIMYTLKLVFARAFQNIQKRTSPVPKSLTCDSCPMHWFHELCSEIEGLNPEKINLKILEILGNLPDNDKEKIVVQFQNLSVTDNVQEQNEIFMMLIREHSEQKQISHTHISKKNGKNNNEILKEKGSKLGVLREKAKKTLSSSFETILKLTSREDLKEGIDPFTEKLPKAEIQISKDYDARSYREGSCDINQHPCEQVSPINFRPRSSTFSSSREMCRSNTHSAQKMPIMSMFSKSHPASTQSLNKPEKVSWKEAIFHRVQAPRHDSKQDIMNFLLDVPNNQHKIHTRRTKEEIRALWKKAINEQLLLIRMEKENKKLQVNQDAASNKRMKLDYEEVTPCLKSASDEWDLIINDPDQIKYQKNRPVLIEAVKKGIPRHKRGEVWQYLAKQNRLLNKCEESEGLDMSYEEHLKQLTSHQHAILIDIGRTFPHHPYFSQHLGAGQLSLFNLLKAYSFYDQEVGYCQGVSFVAGILLLHMTEQEAFFILKHLMYDLNVRKLYINNMTAIHGQMYVFARILHDHCQKLYEHLLNFEIATELFATSWFLTLFSSQFPIGFVSRLFDLVFLFGFEVIFKVALFLMGRCQEKLMKCDSFESIMEFIKNSLPSIDLNEMQVIVNQVFEVDISHELQEFEVEYDVLWETKPHSLLITSEEIERLRALSIRLKLENVELKEKLQSSTSHVEFLEKSQKCLQDTVGILRTRLAAVKDEQEELLHRLHIMKVRLDRLESNAEVVEHPPPINIAYSGTEREEDESFKAFVKEFWDSRKMAPQAQVDIIFESPPPDDSSEDIFCEDLVEKK